jgi:hypothetical protein
MRSSTTSARRWRLGAVIVLGALLTALPAWAGSNSTILPNGAQLTVSIDSPADGTQFLADGAPVPVPVSGTASIGLGTPQATIVYVFDASGSTGGSGGACGTILACEKTFFTGLNTAATSSGSVNHIGLVVFGADAVQADMTPAAGDVNLGAPSDGNTAINSIVLTNGGFNYQVGQYTVKNGDADGTNYTAALQQAVAVLNASSDPKKFLVFASDGLSNLGGGGFGAAVTALTGTGAVANSIAIGASASCTGGTDGDLADIAVNGGTCFSVPDPNDLPDLIPNLIGSTLTKVEMSVDGGAPTAVTTVPPTPQPGPAVVTYSTMTAGLNPGSHDICVTAFGTDVTGGSANVTTCVTVKVYDLVLAPATATNNLGGGDNSHTVTATLQGPAGAVGGYLVTFSVGGQNAGETGTCVPASCQTNAAGVVTFTYDVDIDPSSLGVDTIAASVTLANPTGATDTETVTKEWLDLTPPVVSCQPTTNPSGNNIPPAGNNPHSGQNPDGFYILLAVDLVDPNPDITVSDTGSSFVAGPYPSGTKIKLTQSPGAKPNAKPGPGEIDWHITLKGDAVVTGTDASGNSASVTCLVPPPPK